MSENKTDKLNNATVQSFKNQIKNEEDKRSLKRHYKEGTIQVPDNRERRDGPGGN